MKYDATSWLLPIEVAACDHRDDADGTAQVSALQTRRTHLGELQSRVDRLEIELEHLKELLATVGCSVGSLLGTLERDLGTLYRAEHRDDHR